MSLFSYQIPALKGLIRILLVSIFAVLTSCHGTPSDQTGPAISDIETSGNVLVISDCPSTSVQVSAHVSDPSGIESVLLWYRIASDEKFTSAQMEFQDGFYVVSLKGVDFFGHAYGTIDFYISAQDAAGNRSQSAIDQSIQFLPCVSN